MAGLFGGGGDNQMTVTINGNAAGAAAAAAVAADALGSLGPAAQDAAAQANAALGSIGTTAQGTLGSGTNGLAATAQRAGDAIARVLGTDTGGQTGLISQFGQFGQVLGRVGQGAMGFADSILGALNPLNLFHSSVLRLVEVMSLWRLFDKGLQSVTAFVDGIWQLPIAMEKAEGSWQYMFNPERTRGQSLGTWMTQGQGIAKQISDWTMKQSINLPYTRQDLIQAITSLAPAGLSSQGIEHYLPVIGDIAAAMNPNLSLQQASYSVMGAMMGYSRMLRYDLHINPEQLTQYGYNASNNATLLPALEKFAQARGITSYNARGQDVGAAYNISHSTFWGEWSSLIDRIQNSQIMVGDYGPFGALKKGLEWVNNFIDTHSSDLEKFAHLLGDTIAGGMQAVTHAGSSLLQGLSSTGILTQFVDGFSALGKWLGDPKTQQGIDSLLQLAGKNIGLTLQGFGQGASAVGGALGQAWTNMGTSGQTGLLNALTIPGMLASVLGQGAGGAISSIPFMARAVGDLFTGNFGGAATNFGQFWGHSVEPVGGIYDTVMNWAAHPTHGAGKKWVDHALTQAGGFFQHIGSWIGGTAAPGIGQFFGHVGGAIGGAAGGVGHLLGQTGGAIGGYAQRFGANVKQNFEDAINGPKTFFDWLYNHNTYFQGFVDNLNRGLTTLKHYFQIGWGLLSGIVSDAMEDVKKKLDAALSADEKSLSSAWDSIEKNVKKSLDNAVSDIDKVTKPIRDKVDAIANTFKTGFDALIHNATTWGENLVGNLITGLRNKLGDLGKTAGDVAGELWKKLGFHSPAKEGPGADADTWAPNFVRMFTAGLQAGIPQIAAVAGQMAAALGQGIINNSNTTTYGAQTINIHVASMSAADVGALVGTHGSVGQATAYAQALRAPGGYRQFGALGGLGLG